MGSGRGKSRVCIVFIHKHIYKATFFTLVAIRSEISPFSNKNQPKCWKLADEMLKLHAKSVLREYYWT